LVEEMKMARSTTSISIFIFILVVLPQLRLPSVRAQFVEDSVGGFTSAADDVHLHPALICPSNTKLTA
jgi:hypothetical protein